jgi:hypothetical protein
MGNVTLWQKEWFTPYQLVLIFSNGERETSLIIRGVDLFNSSALQFYMAKVFAFKSLLKVITLGNKSVKPCGIHCIKR